MDEQATFEAGPVLPPRRARGTRLLLVLPMLGLAGIAALGIAGPRTQAEPRPEMAIADQVVPTAPAATSASSPARPEHPAEVLGLRVQRLDLVNFQALEPDRELAVAGWYATTAITGCPKLAAIYKDGALPNVRGDKDTLAFCVRSGVLYASQPGPGPQAPTSPPRNGPARNPLLSVVPVTVAIGVIMPPEIEVIGARSTEIVVLGRFVPSRAGCVFLAGCGGDFVIDHVAWTPAAPA